MSNASDSAPSAHETRSAETRARMIEAAIEVFGRVGYDAANTRELAEQAHVNLSAIPYHFGGKRQLYLAAADAISEYAQDLIAPLVTRLADPSTGDAASRVESALLGFLRIILDDSEPKPWTMYLARCVTEDDEAFHRIYDRAFASLHEGLVDAVQVTCAGQVDEEHVRLRVSSSITALIGFRLLKGIILRGMGWKELRPENTRHFTLMVQSLIGDCLKR